jgi:hypothetical protein
MMRWAGYGLAIVVGVVGLVSGIASGAGALAGLAAGWLVDCAILIYRRETAHVQGQGDPQPTVFALFDNLPPWLWGVCAAILVVGGLVGYLIHH